MAEIKGVLLDVDGTLVDTNDAHARAWVEAFAENGRTVPFERVRPLIGMGSDQLLPRTVGVEKDTPEGKRMADTWSRLFQERYLPHVVPLPGARALLETLHERGLTLVAASSGEQKIADALLERVGAGPYLSDRTTSADADRSKPAPDLIRAAQEKSGHAPQELILLGDTPYDIEAARPLGMPVIALRSGGYADELLAGAVALYNDPADLLAHLDDAPLLGKALVRVER